MQEMLNPVIFKKTQLFAKKGLALLDKVYVLLAIQNIIAKHAPNIENVRHVK